LQELPLQFLLGQRQRLLIRNPGLPYISARAECARVIHQSAALQHGLDTPDRPLDLTCRSAGLRSTQVLPISDLRSQLAGLSATEKAELLDAIWESLESDAQSLTEAQKAELDSRIARHEQNPSDVVSWERVRTELFKKP
jgi:putative addiction module component (TIGR02574 family)